MRRKNSWVPILIVVLVVIGIGFFVTGLVLRGTRDGATSAELQKSILQIRPYDHVRGNATSTVTVVEYSDFQCSTCRQYSGVLRQLEREGVDFRLVYRHYPLNEIHAHADIAARATEAAYLQDPQAFWYMHDLIFDNQELWSDNTAAEMRNALLSYPRLVFYRTLNANQFERDLDSDEIRERVLRDISDGRQLGVNSVPTFFINGERIEIPGSSEEFRSLLAQYAAQ
ncbi:MAG: DsbA family protein [Candidatus Vogelbacteria bacterium]|nr:DsbA family protein [Candidatus Vogelbacteria bacterium]